MSLEDQDKLLAEALQQVKKHSFEMKTSLVSIVIASLQCGHDSPELTTVQMVWYLKYKALCCFDAKNKMAYL